VVNGAVDKPRVPLNSTDFGLFLDNWIDGDRNNMAFAVAGFLRKDLGYSLDEALETIREIHETAGYSDFEEEIEQSVYHTYNTPWAKISGRSILFDRGIIPTSKRSLEVKFARRIVPRNSDAVELIDFSEDVESQQFWIDGLVGPGMTTLWAAPPKTGKSFSVMQLGHALAIGQDIWDFSVDGPRKVLYFQGELSKGMVAERAIQMFGREALRHPQQFALTDRPKKVVSLVEHPEVLLDLAEAYDVIIVDPISVFNSNDENSSLSVRETVATFDSLKEAGKAVILVHHTRKLETTRDGRIVTPSFNDIRGSNAWFAAVDAIALQYEIGDNGATRVLFRYRAAPERQPLTLYRLPSGGFTHDKDYYRRAIGLTRFTARTAERQIN